MALELYTIILGVILAITHFYSNNLHKMLSKIKDKILSFAAGISVAYIFLVLLPDIYQGSDSLINLVFVLIGFALFHLAEKHVYQHKSVVKKIREFKEIHSTVFFLYHIVIGIVLFNLIEKDLIKGSLVFFPILFHTSISIASLNQIHKNIKENTLVRLILSVSTLLGILIAIYFLISTNIINILLGFVGGTLFYIVIREEIPKERQEKTKYFILGLLIYTLLILML